MVLAATSRTQHNTDEFMFSRTLLIFAKLEAFISALLANLLEGDKDSVRENRQVVHQVTTRSTIPNAFGGCVIKFDHFYKIIVEPNRK